MNTTKAKGKAVTAQRIRIVGKDSRKVINILVFKEGVADAFEKPFDLFRGQIVFCTENYTLRWHLTEVVARNYGYREAPHKAKDVMLQQITPYDFVTTPEKVLKTLNWIVQILGGAEIYLLMVEFVIFVEESSGRTKTIKE